MNRKWKGMKGRLGEGERTKPRANGIIRQLGIIRC